MRQPDFIIGDPANPYMLRWYLIPRNRWCNVYLHKFCRDDDDRALHNHPWAFVSLMLFGGYVEYHRSGFTLRTALSIAFRWPNHAHRVALLRDDLGAILPCWTLVIAGPRVQEWGFFCPQGFVPWQEFTKSNAPGEIGRGCGD